MTTPATRSRLAALLPVAAALVLLVSMVALSRDFGVTWDERALQHYGDQIWDFYTGKTGRDGIDLSFGYTRIYGGLVEFLSAALQHVVRADTYVLRHMLNAAFGWMGVVFAFLLGSRLWGQRAGWLAAILMLAMPRYIGESMNNPKDLPFAVLMFIGLYYVVTFKPAYPYFSWPHGLKLALATAAALDVRTMGIGLLGYAGVGLFVAVVASGERSPRRLGLTALRFAAVALTAVVAGTAFWPWAQEQPLVRPVQAFFLASGFNWGNPSIFDGRDVAAIDLPWFYLPKWLALSLPPVLLAGAALSLPRIWRRAEGRVPLLGLWAAVVLPATAAIVRHLTLYDGIRHVFFIVPPIAALAAAGWDFALDLGPRTLRVAVAALLVVGLAEPLLFDLRNHPNENVYFTPAIGGPRGAFGRYEMDYWGNCVLQAVQWSAAQATRAQMPLGVAANAWEIASADLDRFPSLWFRMRESGNYHFDVRLLKGPHDGVVDTAALPDIVHRVTMADGTPICVILPGPDYDRFTDRLARLGLSPDPPDRSAR